MKGKSISMIRLFRNGGCKSFKKNMPGGSEFPICLCMKPAGLTVDFNLMPCHSDVHCERLGNLTPCKIFRHSLFDFPHVIDKLHLHFHFHLTALLYFHHAVSSGYPKDSTNDIDKQFHYRSLRVML